MGQSGLLPILVRWWRVILAAGAVAGAVGFVAASRAESTYESSVQLLTGPINADFETLRASGELSKTYAALILTRPLLAEVAEAVGVEGGADALQPVVRANASSVSRLVTITVRDGDPARAASLATELAAALVRLQQQGEVQPGSSTVDAFMARNELASLPVELRSSLRSAAEAVFTAEGPGSLAVVNPPEVPTDPVGFSPTLLMIVAALAGATAALVVVMIRPVLRNSVDSPERLEQLLPFRCLGDIEPLRRSWAPKGASVRTLVGSSAGGRFRLLATEVGLLHGSRCESTVLIVGADAKCDAGGVAAGLALVVAASGVPVTLVDADTQRAEATALFRSGRRPGCKDVLREGAAMDTTSVAVARTPLTDALNFLPVGSGSAPAVDALTASSLLTHLRAAGSKVSIVVTPALSTSSDALAWAASVDACVLVAHRSRTSADDVARAGRTLAAAGVPVKGTLMSSGRTRFRFTRQARHRSSDEVAATFLEPGTAVAP